MSERDTRRAVEAARIIFSGRYSSNPADVMVTLEHTVAAVLLALYRTPEMAAAMLNEGLVPGIESRLSLHAAKQEGRKT